MSLTPFLFRRSKGPEALLHGGEPYDLITGPLFARYSKSRGGIPIPLLDRLPQSSLHTQDAADLFNSYMKKK